MDYKDVNNQEEPLRVREVRKKKRIKLCQNCHTGLSRHEIAWHLDLCSDCLDAAQERLANK